MYIFAAYLSAAQRRSILGHKHFRDSDWSANNSQPSSEPIGESCTLLGDMLQVEVVLAADGLHRAVKRLGQFFVSFREISFTMKWKHEQRHI